MKPTKPVTIVTVAVGVVLAVAVLLQFVIAALASKSTDYLLFADGTVSASVRAAIQSAALDNGGPSAGAAAMEGCRDLTGQVILDFAIGTVGRASRWDYFPFFRNAIDITYTLPKSGFGDDIATRVEEALIDPETLGDAALFARGLAVGTAPSVQLLHCPNSDVLTISKAY